MCVWGGGGTNISGFVSINIDLNRIELISESFYGYMGSLGSMDSMKSKDSLDSMDSRDSNESMAPYLGAWLAS